MRTTRWTEKQERRKKEWKEKQNRPKFYNKKQINRKRTWRGKHMKGRETVQKENKLVENFMAERLNWFWVLHCWMITFGERQRVCAHEMDKVMIDNWEKDLDCPRWFIKGGTLLVCFSYSSTVAEARSRLVIVGKILGLSQRQAWKGSNQWLHSLHCWMDNYAKGSAPNHWHRLFQENVCMTRRTGLLLCSLQALPSGWYTVVTWRCEWILCMKSSQRQEIQVFSLSPMIEYSTWIRQIQFWKPQTVVFSVLSI